MHIAENEMNAIFLFGSFKGIWSANWIAFFSFLVSSHLHITEKLLKLHYSIQDAAMKVS